MQLSVAGQDSLREEARCFVSLVQLGWTEFWANGGKKTEGLGPFSSKHQQLFPHFPSIICKSIQFFFSTLRGRARAAAGGL